MSFLCVEACCYWLIRYEHDKVVNVESFWWKFDGLYKKHHLCQKCMYMTSDGFYSHLNNHLICILWLFAEFFQLHWYPLTSVDSIKHCKTIVDQTMEVYRHFLASTWIFEVKDQRSRPSILYTLLMILS